MAQPRIASRTPRACAACYQQKTDAVHIDYASALEGRLIDPSAPRGGHVDWVIICEPCLRAGLALLPEERTKVDQLEQQVTDLHAQLAETQAYADRIEDALSHRPASMQKPKGGKTYKQQRRPRYQNGASDNGAQA